MRRPKRREFAWGGVFEGSVGYICKNGIFEQVWPTKLWLYRDGNECSEITGGWEAGQAADRGMFLRGAVQKNTDNITVIAKRINVQAQWEWAITGTMIDVTSYKTLKFIGFASGSLAGICFTSASKTYNDALYVLTISNAAKGQIEADISGIYGQYFIALQSANAGEGTMYELWLEK